MELRQVERGLAYILHVAESAVKGVDGLLSADKEARYIPGWVPMVGGKTFGVSLPRIPALATGGVVMPRSGGVPAILAEAGEAEAVLPLSKLDRLLSRAAAQGRPYSQVAGADGSALYIEQYYAAETSSPQRTADALMFLAKARG